MDYKKLGFTDPAGIDGFDVYTNGTDCHIIVPFGTGEIEPEFDEDRGRRGKYLTICHGWSFTLTAGDDLIMVSRSGNSRRWIKYLPGTKLARLVHLELQINPQVKDVIKENCGVNQFYDHGQRSLVQSKINAIVNGGTK